MIGETNATQEIKFLKFVDYIESTGTQYIDTNVIPNNTTKVVFDMQMIDTTYSDEWQPLFGSRTSSSSNDRFIVWRAGSFQHLAQMYGSFPSSLTAISISENLLDRTVITLDRDKLYCDSTLVASSSELSFNGTYSMFLFTQNTGGAADDRKPLLKLYGCQIYNNDILIRDFKPCIDKDGIYCLYDLVERKFYYNKGTGEFRGEDWQPNYIETTTTGYIDTGIIPTSNTRVESNMAVVSLNSNNYCSLAGSNDFKIMVSNSYFNFCVGTSYQQTSKMANVGTKYKVVNNVNGTCSVDGTTLFTGDPSTVASTSTLKIGAIIDGANIWGSTRVYDFKIYDNDNLVRDFIPALDNSGVACLYEKVSKTYFYNAGTGSFVAG